MATRNDITGDLIKTKANGANEAYSDGWDRIFGKKKAVTNEETKEANQVEDNMATAQATADQLMESAQDWDEERQDVIGQNGNDGMHYESKTPES